MLLTRHAGHHHTINIKYGYAVLGILILYALLLTVARYRHFKNWKTQGRPNNRLIWARLCHVPLIAHVLLWVALVLGLTFFNVTNYAENYTIVLKRIGRLGYCLLPLDILLVIRPPTLGHSYLSEIPLHKWMLRLIIACGVIHGGGYFVKWLIEGALLRKSGKVANLLGIIVFLVSLVLVVLSLRFVRRRYYALFYVIHNITVLAFVALILFHARPGVGDIVLLLAVMLAYQIYRRFTTFTNINSLAIVDKEQSSLRLLRISKPTQFAGQWQAGSHVRLAYPKRDFKSWVLPSHPYTICSLPADATVDLVVKKGCRFQVYSSLDYALSNPYASLPPPIFTSAENVHIICGGSGISLGVPVFRYFKLNSSVQASMTWCVSNKNDTYVLNELKVGHSVDVYVTDSAGSTIFVSGEEEEYGLLDQHDIEMESFLSDEMDDSNPFLDESAQLSARKLVNLHTGRPNLDTIFAPFNYTDDLANKWLVVCGPESLIIDVKKWGGEHKVQVFSELYDM